MSWLVEFLEHACWRKEDKRVSKEATAQFRANRDGLRTEILLLQRRNRNCETLRLAEIQHPTAQH